MRFLNPSFLWFLPLALLPLLLNLAFPLKPVRVPFSSIFLLRAASDSRLKKVKTARSLILFLRCLALFGLIAAFSKPVADWRLPGRLAGLSAGTGRPLSLVVMMDRSLSMNAAFAGRSRRDFAAGTGKEVLASLSARDEAAPVFFDSSAESGEWTGDLAGLSRRLASSRPGFRGTNYRQALEKAYSLLAERPSDRKKAVLVLSDGARNGFESMPGDTGGLASYDPAVTLTGLVFPPAANAWVRGAAVSEEGGRVLLSVRTGGTGGLSGPGLALELYAPGLAGTAKTGGGIPDGPAALFRLPPEDDPSGRAVLSARDPLPQDDAVFFSLDAKKPSAGRILVLYGGPEAMKPGNGAYFMKRFFDTEAGSGGFAADFMELSAFDRVPWPEYGAAVIFDGPVTARQAGAVDRFLKSGGGAMIVSGFPAKRGILESMGFSAGAEAERELHASDADLKGVFPDADLKGFELRRAEVQRAADLSSPPDGFEPVWYFEDPSGASFPALYYGRRGSGRALVWTSSFDLADTDLAAKPIFAPFMEACLRRLRGIRPPRLKGASVGSEYEGTIVNTERVKVGVKAPDGSVAYVLAVDGRFKYGLTDEPGIYVWTAGRETGSFAVNPEADDGESSLEPEKSPPWVRLPPDAPVEAFKNAVYGVEIGQFLLLLALSAFLAEFLLARRML